jgi:hypothetical protein
VPPKFSHENFWCSIGDFHNRLACITAENWGQILDMLDLDSGHETQHRLDDVDLSALSAFQADLLDFSSPMKDLMA